MEDNQTKATALVAGTSGETCRGCNLQCPLDDLQCGRGRHLAQGVNLREDGAQYDEGELREGERGGRPFGGSSAEGDSGHRHHRGGGHGRGHGGPQGQGRHGQGPHARGIFGDEDIQPPSLDAQLNHLLHHSAHLLLHRGSHERGRESALIVLSRHQGMTQRLLARKLDVRPASLSELLGKLEAAGLVQRTQSQADRRTVDVALTEAGQREAQACLARRSEADQDLFCALDDQQKQQLLDLLELLVRDWHENR